MSLQLEQDGRADDGRPVAWTPKGTLQRYVAFVVAIGRTGFFDGCSSGSAARSEGGSEADSTEQPRNSRREARRRTSVLAAVFPPAFAKYALATAIADVLRYALLTSAVGVPKSDLALVVGTCDAACAVGDVLLRLQGSWDAAKAGIVGKRSGPLTAAAVYGAGVVTVTLSALWLGCGDGGGDESAEEGASGRGGPGCETYFRALALYAVGSYLMSMGHGLLWNVWTQTFKPHAELRLAAAANGRPETIEEEGNTSGEGPGERRPSLPPGLDVQGKLSQLQVLFRYAASSVAPPCAAYLLFRTGRSPTASYSVVGLCFLLLCLGVARTVARIGEDAEEESNGGGAARGGRSAPSGGGGEGRGGGAARPVPWSEMLPARATSWLRLRPVGDAAEAAPLAPRPGASPGRFSAAFFHLGAFVSFTEVVRGGYTRIICLRAATSDLSHADLSRVLAMAGALALLSFWLSDLADENRKLSASLSFAILAAGHFGLVLSTSMAGFLSSAAVFGLGEGASTGLRALLKQDYLHENGPLGELTGHGADGRRLRRQVCNKIGIWSDVTLIVNSLVVGVIGHFFGMRAASFAFGMLGVYAMHFSWNILPDTKPRK